MTEDVALYEVDGNVAVVTMNRPDKRNALSVQLKDKLVELMRRAEADDNVAVIVLRGKGRTFCAGADISPSPDKNTRKGDALKTHAHHRKTLAFHLTPWELAKPVIASVQGHAMGAGCEFAMMCDMTIAADTAIFGEPEIRFASIGSAVIMPWIIGPKRARQLLYLGDTISAARAEQIGMINMVVPEAELEAETLRFAHRLALIGREALSAMKMAVNRGIEAQGFRNALEDGCATVALIHTSKVESDRLFYEKVAAEGAAAAFKWRNAQFRQ
jgi:enoyl-CoA hydratase/carnithine racemase